MVQDTDKQISSVRFVCVLSEFKPSNGYSYVSNKRRVANKSRVWKKYQNLINTGSGTNGGPGIFVRLNKEIAENSHFFRFAPIFSMTFEKMNKRRVWNNCVGPGIFPQKE